MKNNKKGFTLAELLIVIAIIAILIAIAIPVFASQLRAARLSTDHANIRSAYAWAQSANLMGQADLNGNGTIATGERAGETGYGTTVCFYRDGSIKTGTPDATKCYTLMVSAEDNECLESAACNTDSYLKKSDGTSSMTGSDPSSTGHVQDNYITIQYLDNDSENAWYVIMGK